MKKYSYNVIVMKIISQVEYDGHNPKTLYGIMDYKWYESAVSKYSAFITNNRGVIKLRKTKIGWKFLIQCKYLKTTWMDLKIMKESNPAEVVYFLVARGISYEPEFSLWVTFTLKKRDIIISALNSRVINKNNKFGIEVPIFIEHAKWLNAKNGYTMLVCHRKIGVPSSVRLVNMKKVER